MGTSNKKYIEQLWNFNKFDLLDIAKPSDNNVIKESENLRQLHLILMLEFSKDIYASNKAAMNNLKNLTFFVQQNLLLCCDYIINNISVITLEGALKSSISLQKLLLKNSNIRIKKGDQPNLLRQNNEGIISTIKALTR